METRVNGMDRGTGVGEAPIDEDQAVGVLADVAEVTLPSVKTTSISPNCVNDVHLLENTWSLWVLLDREGISWSDAQQCVHKSVASAEDFWRLVRHVHPPSALRDVDYSLFHEGISPAREDPSLHSGGRWIVAFKAGKGRPGLLPAAHFLTAIDNAWLSVLLSLIGGGFDSGECGVCGAVIAMRTHDGAGEQAGTSASAANSAKLAIWLRRAEESSQVRSVGATLVEVLASTLTEARCPGRGWQVAFEDFRQRRVTMRLP